MTMGSAFAIGMTGRPSMLIPGWVFGNPMRHVAVTFISVPTLGKVSFFGVTLPHGAIISSLGTAAIADAGSI